MSDQLVASLYVHQQLVRLAHIVLGTNVVVFSLFWNVFGFTWMRVISLQWKESALSISPLSIAVMLSISYSHSLSATLTFHNVCASVFPSLLSLPLSLYFVSLFFLSLLLSLLSSPSERASWTAAGCTSATPPRKLRTHKRKGSSPVDGKFHLKRDKSVPHPEELLSSQDTKLAEDGTIVVCHLLT